MPDLTKENIKDAATGAATKVLGIHAALPLDPGPLIEVAAQSKAADILANGGASTLAPANSDTPAPRKEVMSRGEKLYNTIVYKGINYWMNLGISLIVTDIFTHKPKAGTHVPLDITKGKAHEFYINTVNKLANALNHGKLSQPTATRIAEIACGTFTLNSGGNLLLIPTKYIEDNKRPLVHWLNKKLGVDQTAPDGHQMTSDEIFIAQEQPKQSWGRMIWRRAIGFGATNTTGLAIDFILKEKLEHPTTHPNRGYEVTHKNGQAVFTDTVVGWLDKVPGVNKALQKPTIRRYTDYAALDSIYTVITSTILHKTNGAGPGKEPNEIGDDDAPLVDPKSKNRLRYMSVNEDKKFFAEQETRKRAMDERKTSKKPQESYATSIQQQSASTSEPGLGT